MLEETNLTDAAATAINPDPDFDDESIDSFEHLLDRPDLEDLAIDGLSQEPDESRDEHDIEKILTLAYEEVNPAREKLALREIARGLREDSNVLTLFKLVRRTPDIFYEVLPVLKRAKEFQAAVSPGQKSRAYTALFAGIALSKRGRELLDFTIDRSVSDDSGWLKEQIRQGHTYVPEIVIGSGTHAAIYNSERQWMYPQNQTLTLDLNPKVGGQFSQPESSAWRLNTRTRPESPHAPHVPGGKGSLNTLGRGMLQQADLSSEAYGTQDSLATAIRVDHLLSSRILYFTEVIGVGRNAEHAGANGKYRISFIDTSTGETLSLTTDRVIIASGLGESLTGFEKSDDETKRVLEEELDKENDPRIMLFERFMQRVAEESDPFPLAPFKRVAIIGAGDGGAVAAEYLLGYGPEPRKSVVQLDHIESLHWIGQKAMTRSEYVEDSRQRYRDLALEFPVEGVEDYNHRIMPVPDRAYKLEKLEDGSIKIFYGKKQSDGHIEPSGEVIVDHVILATGFKDSTDEICQSLFGDLTAQDIKTEIVTDDKGSAVARRYADTEVYKVGSVAQLPISQGDRRTSPMLRVKDLKSTVALWASAEETQALARMLPVITLNPDQESLVDLTRPRQEFELPPIDPGMEFQGSVKINVDADDISDLLNPDSVSQDILRFSIGERFRNVVFPDSQSNMNMTIRQTERPTNQQEYYSFDIVFDPPIARTPEYQQVLERLFSDHLFQATLVRLTERSFSSAQTVQIQIPIVSRRVDTENITSRNLHGGSSNDLA